MADENSNFNFAFYLSEGRLRSCAAWWLTIPIHPVTSLSGNLQAMFFLAWKTSIWKNKVKNCLVKDRWMRNYKEYPENKGFRCLLPIRTEKNTSNPKQGNNRWTKYVMFNVMFNKKILKQNPEKEEEWHLPYYQYSILCFWKMLPKWYLTFHKYLTNIELMALR